MGNLGLRKIIFYSISFGIVIICAEKAFPGDDEQFWNEVVFKHKVNSHLETHLKLEQRFVNDFGDFGLHNYTPGFVYNLKDYLEFELNYKYEAEKRGKEWTDEHRVEIIPILKWNWEEIKFKVRNRLEYRDIEGETSWRLREKIAFKRKMDIEGVEVNFSASEEIFYDFKIGQFNQNRIKLGLSKNLNSIFEAGLFYMYKSNKGKEDWFGAHILGTAFVIGF
jgi:hypothetical protein